MTISQTVRALLTLGKGVVEGLPELKAIDDPIVLFRDWFDTATEAGLYLPEAVTLATASPDGAPSARMVLLKGFDADGFVFFTNYGSRKAAEMEANPRAALCFHWAVLQRQVRIEGGVERITVAESEAYFRTRARGSQIGAWASRQSSTLDSREGLETAVHDLEKKYRDTDIPRPPFWGGLRLVPVAIEFWQGRINRLHDRLLYRRQGDTWMVTRLYP